MDNLLHQASNTAEDFHGGISGMARAIGKDPCRLAHELSATERHKLGLIDAIKMVKRSKDWRLINEICREVGGEFVPGPALLPQGGETFADLGALAKEFADVLQQVSKRAADNKISDNDLEVIEREYAEMTMASQVFMANLREKHKADAQREQRLAQRAG